MHGKVSYLRRAALSRRNCWSLQENLPPPAMSSAGESGMPGLKDNIIQYLVKLWLETAYIKGYFWIIV
jgi:hypothetical protein